MKIEFDRPMLYMSHSIRGSNNDIKGNCTRASKVAKKIKNIFPEIGIYCPADSDLIVQILWDREIISTQDIMSADLEILSNCNGWFWWKTDESEGCYEEYLAAIDLGFVGPEAIFYPDEVITIDLMKSNYSNVRRLLTPIVEDAKDRFKEKSHAIYQTRR